MKRHPRILPRKAIDNGRDKSCCHRFGTSDPYFSSIGIGQKFDLFHALPELVEHGDAALEQCAAVDRGLDPMRSPVEEAEPDSMLDVSTGMKITFELVVRVISRKLSM